MIERYSLKDMKQIWELESKFNFYLQVELAVCEAYNEIGKISDEDLETIKKRASFSVERIDEIEVGDKLLAFNTDTGLLSPDPVLYCDSHQNKTHSHYDKYEFDDGTVIKVVHRHRFYNVEEQRMIHLDVFFIGDRVYKEDGTLPKLISAVNHAEEGEIRHYTIFSKYNNYFANGILSGNSRTKEITIKEDI